MPISKVNAARYPRNWKAINAAIRERDGNRCKFCGVPNGAVGYRDADGRFVTLANSWDEAGMECEVADDEGRKVIRIVLTVAHLNHRPEDVEDSNLAALCQRCHLGYDAGMHQRHSSETRKRRKAVSDLFEEPQA